MLIFLEFENNLKNNMFRENLFPISTHLKSEKYIFKKISNLHFDCRKFVKSRGKINAGIMPHATMQMQPSTVHR